MFDVIIVGSGVAGSFFASQLSPQHNILIIERNKKIMPKDSGIVSTNFGDIFGRHAKHLIKHKISRMDFVSPSGLVHPLQSDEPFAYILRRRRFARFIRKNAKNKADIVYGNVNGIKFEKDCVIVRAEGSEYKAKIIAGCDGANSVVRNAMKIEQPKQALGIMVKTRQKIEGDISVFFHKYYSPDFFSWIIPQNKEYGLMTAVRPADYFKYFVKDMYLPSGRMYAYNIPYSYTKSYADRAILIGDACGQNKPLTGGGIMFSMTAARHAAIVINDALEEGRTDADFLGYYEKYWKKDFAWEIEKQFILRLIYKKLTNKEIDNMFNDFCPVLENLSGFDYDKISALSKSIPRLKLLKFLVTKMPRIFW